MFYFTEYSSWIGRLTIASDGKSIVGLWMDGQKYFLNTLSQTPIQKDDIEIFDQAKKWLNRYFAGEKPTPEELPLKPIGGEFRQAVWKCLCEIPYGQVTAYNTIAETVAESLVFILVFLQCFCRLPTSCFWYFIRLLREPTPSTNSPSTNSVLFA